jgi:hypothetical protein
VYSILKVEKKRLRESLPPARLTQQRDYLQWVFYLVHRLVNGAQEMQHSADNACVGSNAFMYNYIV